MAGEIKLNNVSIATENAGTVTINNATLGNSMVLGTTASPIANNLVFANGNGIDFSAAAGSAAGSSSAVLDDYEEGTWTPVASGITFSNQGGSYVKIGNFVHIQGFVDFPTTTSTAGASIGGLPFTNVKDGGGFTLTLETFTGSQLTVYHPKNQSYVAFYENGVIKDNVHLSGMYFYFSGSYTTS